MSRYFIFLPSLMLLRWILSVPTVKSTALGNSAAAVFLLAMPFFVLSVVVYHVGLDVEPCVEPNEVLPCVREGIDPDLAVGSGGVGQGPPPGPRAQPEGGARRWLLRLHR